MTDTKNYTCDELRIINKFIRDLYRNVYFDVKIAGVDRVDTYYEIRDKYLPYICEFTNVD